MILSCDPGVDDALALGVLAGLRGGGVEAVVAQAGNVAVELAIRNAAGLVAAFDLGVPVARGSASALRGPFPGEAAHVHGDDGVGGASSLLPRGAPVVDDGVALIAGTVVATGPLTDVARALARDQPVDSVTWMGGSIEEGGNVTTYAEFNAWCDPDAVNAVVGAVASLRVVPLDVTHRVRLTGDDLARLPNALVVHLGRHLVSVGGHLHDPTAIVAHLHPDLFRWEPMSLSCVADGERSGETVSAGLGAVEVAIGVDGEAVREVIVGSLSALPA